MMSDGDMRFTANEYWLLMQLTMVSDPWPLSDLDHERMVDMLNKEAEAREYDSWIHAYHEWEADDE